MRVMFAACAVMLLAACDSVRQAGQPADATLAVCSKAASQQTLAERNHCDQTYQGGP